MSALNPQPQVFPICSACDTAYVLRRAICLSTGDTNPLSHRIGEQWVWQRDCKHKTTEARIIDRRPKKTKLKLQKRAVKT